MADVVNGKFLILYARIATDLQPIACAKGFEMVITTEEIELAPKTDSTFRVYRPGKKQIKFSGNGLVKIISSGQYNPIDLTVAQLGGQIFTVRFSLQDPQANQVYYEVDVMITETNEAKVSGQSSTYSFSMLAVGKVKIVGGTNVGGIFTEQYTTQFV